MADKDKNSIQQTINNTKNPKLHPSFNNPANPGFPTNADDYSKYPANPSIPAEINNPANPGYPINAARY